MTKGNAKKGTEKPKAAVRRTTEMQTNVTTNTNNTNTKVLTTGNFHEITVGAPCRIFVDKKTAALYITTNTTTVVNKRTQTAK